MKVLFATTNPAKIKKYVDKLKEKDIEILTIKDLGINLKPEETGKNAIDNAYIFEQTYYDKTKIISIGMDNNLYIEGLPDEKQPGTHVRRINGKELNDEEMIEYYTSLVKKYGVDNKLNCKWVYGLAVIDKSGCESTYTWYKDDFYMTDISSDIINPGYPLNTISKYKKIDKYFTDKLSEEEKEIIDFNEDSTIEFIKDHI